ncbi:MAG: M48 family metallopeptidase [Paracoccaceae bacterium]
MQGQRNRMTALDDFAKLEAEGAFFEASATVPRDVVVSFGERSLVISDFSDRVLVHWPLASLDLQEDGASDVAVLPDPASAERVVLSDPVMIAALRKVCPGRQDVDATLQRRRSIGVRGMLLCIAILAGLIWLAKENLGHLAGMVPPGRADALGAAMAKDVAELLGNGTGVPQICNAPEGVAALEKLVARLLPAETLPHPLRVSVLDHADVDGIALPGGHILLLRGVLDHAESPEEAAGVLAHLMGHVKHGDPVRQAIRAAGFQSVLGLVIGDILRDGVVVPASRAALEPYQDMAVEVSADTVVHELLEEAGLPSLPYARFVDRLGSSGSEAAGSLGLHPDPGTRAAAAVEADRIGANAFAPALDDRTWIALQNICEG